MATYQILTTESNEVQPLFEKHKNFISFNINSEEYTSHNYDFSTTRIAYKCETIIVRNGCPTKDELTRFFVHLKYTIDDEIAILRQATSKPQEFEEYNAYVEECKSKAKYLMEIYEGEVKEWQIIETR